VCAAAAVQVGIAAAFGVSWSGGVASWVAIIVMGTAAFTGIGFLIAASARAPHVANTMANLVFMPMLALGGTALPASMMPQAWAHVHQVLPAATIFDGLLGAFVRGESVGDNLPRLGYLAAWALVTFAAAGYRWTRRGMTP
jgi:ABC-2 type transport system permease protein